LLQTFQHLFQPPVGLPPKRACDHVIPLVPEAQNVAIRPYRYPPKLKDELEKEVAEMLEQGIIQPSKSLFSSPVLLVPKKDGSYIFVWILDSYMLLLSSLNFQYPSLTS
jgi:hypothetical protein